MGNQPAQSKSSIPVKIILPSEGYRITNLEPSINSHTFRLNIMTDYVIGKDPRLINLKNLHEANQNYVQFDVFSILDYRTRKVKIQIQKNTVQTIKNIQNFSVSEQVSIQNLKSDNINQKKQFSLGILFKYYPKINDTILRISKIFKNSPLQTFDIKKDEYIVGLIEGDFTSMKSFVNSIKLLIESKFQYITLAICNADGITRLNKIGVNQLEKWKQKYGIGYLGVELAEGWLNKWELKKHIDSNKKKYHSAILQTNQTNSIEKSISKNPFKSDIHTKPLELDSICRQIPFQRKEVDFFKQSCQITPPQQNIKPLESRTDHSLNQLKINNSESKQTNQSTIQTLKNSENLKQQKVEDEQKKSKISNFQDFIDSNSQISSNQIDQKCSQLENSILQNKKREMNLIKKSKNFVEINFKDDASSICVCKDYSKHCEKCFKQKEQHYCFFNKKTNKIILIEKSMLFSKKS